MEADRVTLEFDVMKLIIRKIHTLLSNPVGVLRKYSRKVFIKLKGGIPPVFREDYNLHWNFTSFRNKVVLDLGADYGSTAYYFLQKGASKVIVVEGDPNLASKLKTNSKKFQKIIPVELFIDSSEKIEKLISHYHPDLVKVDIEGYERLLLNVKNIVDVNEWLIEAHTEELNNSIVKFLLAHGFSIRSFLYINNLKIIHAYQRSAT
jgi:precorrin-6B methylase 2